jgi:hypothetical protein
MINYMSEAFMLLFLIAIAALGTLFTFCIAIAEVWTEKDWPRKTGWFFVGMVISTCLLIVCL